MGGSNKQDLGPARRREYPARAHLRAVLALLPGDVSESTLVMRGGSQLPVGSSDQFYPFIQDADFYYLTGYGGPDATFLYDVAESRSTLLIPPLRRGRDIAYLGQRETVQCVAGYIDVDRVSYSDPLTVPSSSSGSSALVEAIRRARRVKDGWEVDCISRASNLSTRAHLVVAKSLRKARTEKDLEVLFRQHCILRGKEGTRMAYEPIFAAGRNASVLHYTRNHQPLAGAELILVDAACTYRAYASDVTRTFPLSGHFSPLAKKLYVLVLRLQELAIQRVAPGISVSEINEAVHEVLSQWMVHYQWINCDTETARALNLSKAFLMHGLGHHIGLDVHDPAPVNVPLLPGNVITIEPGVYFNHEFLQTYFDDEEVGQYFNQDVIKQWSHLGGVRIEDVVLVTESGCRVLTELGKTVEEVEEMCR